MATAEVKSQSRIEALSRPKQPPPGFSEDRRSVYWVDFVPPRPSANGTTQITATPRVEELARHRRPHGMWRGDRPTPIWPVQDGAKQANSTERILQLSRHKTFDQFVGERSPYSTVTDGAQKAAASQRIEQLSVPRRRQDKFGYHETEWGQHEPPSQGAMRANYTERIESLSMPKGYHKSFQDERQIQWDVTNPALNAIATLRLQQLARPRSRTMIKDDYDPYKVSQSAKRARCTPRVDELCAPIPRKIRQKKVA